MRPLVPILLRFPSCVTNQLWTVVLAAGAGRRLASLTGGVPKQFWRGARGTSLLDETIDRFAPLAPPSRTVVIVDAEHRDHVATTGLSRLVGGLVFQPEDRGTAAGVLLALEPLLDTAHDAVVAITPSDHGVVDDARFRHGVLEATRYARARGDIVLFGVQPTAAYDDYGWITPGPASSLSPLRPIVSFVEKPTTEAAARLFRSGAVWNTMVVVGRASGIRALYCDFLPELAEVFETALRLPPFERSAFFTAVYPSLPRFDFSRDVLTPARDLSTYIWPVSVGWSDLGTPERLYEWQRHAEASGSRRPTLTAA